MQAPGRAQRAVGVVDSRKHNPPRLAALALGLHGLLDMSQIVSAVTTTSSLPVLTAKDFASDQEIRWCPRCGDYSILAQMKKVLPTLGIPKEKFVFVSGIGCSSRFPYYMDT